MRYAVGVMVMYGEGWHRGRMTSTIWGWMRQARARVGVGAGVRVTVRVEVRVRVRVTHMVNTHTDA